MIIGTEVPKERKRRKVDVSQTKNMLEINTEVIRPAVNLWTQAETKEMYHIYFRGYKISVGMVKTNERSLYYRMGDIYMGVDELKQAHMINNTYG